MLCKIFQNPSCPFILGNKHATSKNRQFSLPSNLACRITHLRVCVTFPNLGNRVVTLYEGSQAIFLATLVHRVQFPASSIITHVMRVSGRGEPFIFRARLWGNAEPCTLIRWFTFFFRRAS